MTGDELDARRLLSAAAVRNSAHRMLALACDGRLDDWRVDLDRLAPTADFVASVIRERYPQLDPPLHARWRHFVFARRDLWTGIEAMRMWIDPAERARCAFDLVITSVLLDAGAGSEWRYRDPATGIVASRSEGLALASLRWFASGGLSSHADPLRADAAALTQIDAATLSAAFQVTDANQLAGLPGRAQLLNRLGATLQARPKLFALADSPRPGGLFDTLATRAAGKPLRAAAILECVLDAFGPIWQNRPTLAGVPLGDCWPHPALTGQSSVRTTGEGIPRETGQSSVRATGEGIPRETGPSSVRATGEGIPRETGSAPSDRYAALHKLSQWLTYSLIEPLQAAGIAVCDLDELTGLAEYRNGGLFVDMGVLVPRDREATQRAHRVEDPFIVAWRAMTVALLDQLAPLVRERLAPAGRKLSLSSLLEGGTWAAGRRLAGELRAGAPPFQILSDGTVF